MREVFIDVETYSEANLKKTGTDVYASHPTTEVLLVSWAVDDGPTSTWDVRLSQVVPTPLRGLFEAQDTFFHAWNARFENAIFREVLGIRVPLERWYCDMVHALSLGLPASLAEAGAAVGLPESETKTRAGRRYVQLFCGPTPSNWRLRRCSKETHPEEWAGFLEYNAQDVVAERAIYRRLERWPVSALERGYWRLDQKVNDTGLPIDRVLVEQAIEVSDRNTRNEIRRAMELTGGVSPNNPVAFRGWLHQQGVPVPDITKHTVARTLEEEDLPPAVREVLQIRQSLGKTSTAKYRALTNATSADGRLRGCLQFYGAARTGRWAGRVFQPQNLPRGGVSDPDELRRLVGRIRAGGEATQEELSDAIRAAVRAPEGKLLRVADLANIESRILGWISDSERMLRVFATGEDIYRDFASQLYRIPVEEVTKEQRNYAKPPTLGCGYGLGAKGLVAYADGMFVTMTQEEAQEAVDVFRSTYGEVVSLWRALERVTKHLLREREGLAVIGRLRFQYQAPFLFMVLPSGRRLAYLHPKLEQRPAPWDPEQLIDQVTYMGLNQYTRKWERMSTFGGKWVEQACQAISRDLLAYGMAEADRLGFEVIGSTHDELIALTDADDWRDHEVLAWCMTRMPPWGDDKLHLGAAGFSDEIYRKD